MSLLDGLKDSLKNPLAENNDEMEFILESDFETALEKSIDVKLSPADIAAILNGDDDIDDEEDDLDDLDDNIDKDTIDDLQKAKEALEATMTEIGIDTAADELNEDDDLDDPELDPEGEDEILSEEAYAALEGVNIEAAKMIRDGDVKRARELLKEAKRDAKKKDYSGAVKKLNEAESLVNKIKEKVAKIDEPSGLAKVASYLTPIFTTLPTGSTKLTGVGFSTNGDMSYQTTTTYYRDQYSEGTDSDVKRRLQYKFNLLLKTIYELQSKYSTLAKTQKKATESVESEVLDPEPLPEDDAKATKKADTGEASIPENLKDPTPDGDEHQIKKDKEALEAVLAALEGDKPECEIEKAKVTKTADTGEASIPKNSGKLPEDADKLTHETGDASIPENTQDPTPDGDEHQIKKDEEALEALIAALESDDKPEIDNDPSATECDTTETGAAGTLANADDATPNGDTEEPAGAENDAKGEECDTGACESKKEDNDSESDDDESEDTDDKKSEKDSDDSDSDDDESDDDKDEKKKDKKSKKEDSDDDSDEKDEDDDSDKDDDKEDKKSEKKDKKDDKDEKKDEDEDDEPSLESILDDLLSL